MLRVCMTAPLPLETREINGKKLYKINEYASNQMLHIIDTFRDNNTYDVYGDPKVCEIQMKDNSSDISSDFFSPGSFENRFHVPVIFFDEKTSIVAGYDILRTKTVDKSSALSNFKLMEGPVYIGALFLIFLFMLAIAARTLINLYHQVTLMKLKAANAPNGYLHAMEIEKIRQSTATAHIRRKIFEDVYEALFGSGETSPYITLLFVILLFYLFASFNALYKTSCIEIEDPKLIKTYEQLLQHERALPIMYDAYRKVSDSFESAPEGSLKKRVWSKLMDSGADLDFHIFGRGGSIQVTSMETGKKYWKMMDTEKYVFIISSALTPPLRGVLCGVSPDGALNDPEELRHMETFIDPIESSKLVGLPLAVHLSNDRDLIRKVRRLSESQLTSKLIDGEEEDSIDHWGKLLQTNTNHVWRQFLACGDTFQPEIDDELRPMNLEYFRTLFIALILVYCISFVINRVEYLFLSPPSSRKRRATRRHFM